MAILFKEVSYDYSANTNQFYQAIRNINLSISDKDEFICLVGHTGSGKSTLAQHMNALIFPTSGSVEVFGKTITAKRDKKIKYNDIRKKVGLVFQFPEYQLFEETVEKDIMFGPLNFKVPLEEARQLAKKALSLVGLNETYLQRNPFRLSGGEKKRVSIAGILALDPQILVLDEPTSGLDPQGKKQLMELFLDIQKTTSKTIIVITHDMDLVYEYANRVIVLNDGNLTFDGTPNALFKRKNLDEYHLGYPQTIRVLRALKEKFGLNIDEYQTTLEACMSEIKKVTSL